MRSVSSGNGSRRRTGRAVIESITPAGSQKFANLADFEPRSFLDGNAGGIIAAPRPASLVRPLRICAPNQSLQDVYPNLQGVASQRIHNLHVNQVAVPLCVVGHLKHHPGLAKHPPKPSLSADTRMKPGHERLPRPCVAVVQRRRPMAQINSHQGRHEDGKSIKNGRSFSAHELSTRGGRSPSHLHIFGRRSEPVNATSW